MMNVEWICTAEPTNAVFLTLCNRNSFWNWTKESINDRELLGPRTRSKCFDLSMINRIMCITFHSHDISMSKKKRGL